MDAGNERTVKDMSEEYIKKLASILEEIDSIKFQMMESKQYVIYLKQRLKSLFFQLYGKLNEKERVEQRYILDMIKRVGPVFYHKNSRDQFGDYGKVVRYYPDKYEDLTILLEDQELHLRAALERLGLTAASVEKKRRLR